MTEKQGGSDVRANTTARRPGGGDGSYRLTGHKWFCSAPMCDLFLVLAQAPEGLSCFLLPRVLPDGSRNAMRIQRLKDKLGNRSNASAEVEFDGALGLAGRRAGPGRAHDHRDGQRRPGWTACSAAPRDAAAAGVTAVHHAPHRSAFGARAASTSR